MSDISQELINTIWTLGLAFIFGYWRELLLFKDIWEPSYADFGDWICGVQSQSQNFHNCSIII